MTIQAAVEPTRPLLGIGWDVGGWIGKKQALAIVTWDEVLQEPRWIGRDGGKHDNPFSLAGEPVISVEPLVRKVWGTAPPSVITDHEICLAVDAPFGFPARFIDLLVLGAPQSGLSVGPEICNPFAYRETDRHIHRRFEKKPLSASFDKLGNNATSRDSSSRAASGGGLPAGSAVR